METSDSIMLRAAMFVSPKKKKNETCWYKCGDKIKQAEKVCFLNLLFKEREHIKNP